MGTWLASAWGQIWPNLAANILWVPLVWAHHLVMSRRVRDLRQHVTTLHAQHEALIVQHVLGRTTAGTKQEGAADERPAMNGA